MMLEGELSGNHTTIYRCVQRYAPNWKARILPVSRRSEIPGTGPNMCEMYSKLVIVTDIWQKLSSFEQKKTLIVKNYWQLLSHIIGETLHIATHIWRKQIVQIPIALTGKDSFFGG